MNACIGPEAGEGKPKRRKQDSGLFLEAQGTANPSVCFLLSHGLRDEIFSHEFLTDVGGKKEEAGGFLALASWERV